MASNTSVLGRTFAEVSRSFVDLMPASLLKDKFFEQVCPGVSCVCETEDEPKYTLEGTWESVVKAQLILASWLEKWISSSNTQGTNNDKKLESLIDASSSLTSKLPSILVSPELAKNNISLPIKIKDPVSVSEGIPAVLSDNHPSHQSSKEYSKDSDLQHRSSRPLSKHSPKKYLKKNSFQYNVQTPSLQSSTEKINLENGKEVNEEACTEGSADDASLVEEVICSDILGEHNYNNLNREEETGQKENIESAIENEIYMDIKLSKKPDDKIFDNPNFPVALVLSSEDHPCVEVVQLTLTKEDTKKYSIDEGGSDEYMKDKQKLMKLRKKKYEEDTPYKFFCTKCSFKTKRHSHMNKHSQLHERVCKIYSCPDCDFSSIRLCHLQRHSSIHKNLDLSCDQCSYTTHKEELLVRHQKNRHMKNTNSEDKAGDQFQCIKCSYMTSSGKFLERHMLTHAKEETENKTKLASFKCEDCSYKSPSRSNYYRHIASVHGDDRPYLCTTCGLSFKRSDTLFQHRATHVDVDPQLSFSCSLCKKFYRTEKLLREHVLTHAEERSFLCEVCGAAFKTRAVQRKHFQEVHILKKSHACSLCGKKFLSKSLVKRHMKVHLRIPKRSLSPLQDANGDPELYNIDSKQWCKPVMQIPSSEDVQVLIVQSDEQQPELVLSPTTILVQGNSLSQVAPAEPITVPVEFVISDEVSSVANSVENHSSSTEEYITLSVG